MKKTSRLLAAAMVVCMLLALPAMAFSEEPGASAEPIAQPFSEAITYNDTTYGYGPLDLVVTGEASSDGAITISDVTWYGESVIYYMTDAIRAELEELLLKAGVVPAAPGEPAGDPQGFAQTVAYNDTTYGYGLVDLTCTGVVNPDGSIELYSVSWYGEEVSGMLTPEIEAELDALLAAAGVAYGA